MCVHVFCVPGKMPHDALLWVEHLNSHACVYVDAALLASGRLTAAAVKSINEALGTAAPGLTLDSAAPCHRPLLHAVAG